MILKVGQMKNKGERKFLMLVNIVERGERKRREYDGVRESEGCRGQVGLRGLLERGKVILINHSNWPRVVCDRIVIKRYSEYRSN